MMPRPFFSERLATHTFGTTQREFPFNLGGQDHRRGAHISFPTTAFEVSLPPSRSLMFLSVAGHEAAASYRRSSLGRPQYLQRSPFGRLESSVAAPNQTWRLIGVFNLQMGALKYLEELHKKKQSDVLRFLLRVRCWEVSVLSTKGSSPSPRRGPPVVHGSVVLDSACGRDSY